MCAALVSVAVTTGIVVVLVKESLAFFEHVPPSRFLTDTQWTPLFSDAHYGILPLLSGTLVSSAVALVVAIPLGTIIAIYLSEFAPHAVREVAKPFLELLGGVPTIVYGYFALLFVTPAAFSGIAAAYILGISRAVGETMIVAVAAGMQPNLTWNPLEPAATITAYIVQVALGDLPHGSLAYQTIFAAGLTLALVTLLFNLLGHLLRKRFRQAY